jgi:SAM-dependent methyltransferase
VSENRNEEWFAEWFDTPWYHVLYGNRNDAEAEAFIKRLFSFLGDGWGREPAVLDLACGAGRHARVFESLGCRVTGFDLSAQSIEKAREIGPSSIRYVQGDMRTMQLNEHFDLVANLFTSFGYFDEVTDNAAVVNAVHRHLTTNGVFVLDFLNAPLVVERLVRTETVERGGIHFNILRNATDNHIVKEIRFEADNRSHFYTEKVQALSPATLQTMLTQQSFVVKNVFGDYNLTTFAPQTSPRVILVAQKL